MPHGLGITNVILGNMKMEKLGKYCKIISGYAFKSNDLSEGTEIPVIKIGNISNGDDVITDSSTQYVSSDFLSIDEKYHIKKGDVLISLTGSHINQPNSMVGRSCRNFSDTEFLLNQRAGKVIPNENADKNYLYYLLNTESFKYSICNRAYGAANQANVSPSDIENIKWNFPPLPTQQKIASILSAYDNLIQNYKKQIEALQTAASELYKEWFVRFRFPGYKNSRFENGIPEGWKVEKLFDVAKIIYGYPFNSDEFCDDSSLNPVVRIRDILDNYTNTYTSETCDEKYWINPNEMLIGMDGIFHMSLWTGKRALQNQRTVRVTSKVKNLSNYYLYFSLYPQIKALEQMIVGTTVAHLGDKHIKKITILIPEDKILKMSFERLEPIMNRIYSLQQQITNLTQQRDLLLPRLMSDKLEVE